MGKTWKDREHKKSITTSKWTPNKMPPYLSSKNKGTMKFAVDLGDGTGVSKLGKLITKNANRSLKKSKRQELKKELNKFFENENE